MNVCGTELRGNKPLLYSLTKIKGIGFATAKKILHWLNLPNEIVTNDVAHMASAIEEIIRSNKIVTGNTLTAEINENIKMLISIGCRKGVRHKNALPVNGQSTRTNASTVKRRRKGNG